MQSQLYILREIEHTKGMNDKYPPELLPEGYLALAQNAVITQNRIEKRKGYSLIGQDMGNKAILGLHGITTSSGTQRLYAFLSNSGGTAIEIWEYTGSGSWSRIDNTLLTSLTRGEVNCVNAENVVYAFDGVSTPVVITPGSPSTVAAVTDGNFPKGSFGVWFHNFHFVAGVVGNRSTLYWSDLEDSDDFTNGVTGNVLINPDDGDEITGLATLGDQLIIFKRNRIWALTGFGTTTFAVDDLSEVITGLGTVSYRSIVNNGSDLYFISHVGGDPEIRSLRRTQYGTLVTGAVLSDDILGTMKTLNTARLKQTSGVFAGDIMMWSFCETGDITNQLVMVYDLDNKGWVKWTGLNASILTEFNFSNTSAIYFGESSANSLVYKLDTSTTDNGSAIEFDVRTRSYGVNRPEIKKKWKYLYMTADSSGDWDLTVNYSPDGFTFGTLDTFNLKTIGSVFPFTFPAVLGDSEIKRKRLHFAKTTSYYLQLQFYNNAASQDVVIRDWEILWKNRGLRLAYKTFT